MGEEMFSMPWKIYDNYYYDDYNGGDDDYDDYNGGDGDGYNGGGDDDDSYSRRRTNVSCYDRKFVCKIRISAALTRHL
jgi:hypothetical protein